MENPGQEYEGTHSQSQEEQEELFKGLSPASLELLEQRYNKHMHAKELSNYCWRCHQTDISLSYQKFKNQHHPELAEPKISNFYPNQAFVELQSLGIILEKGAGQLQGPFIGPIPKNLKQMLDQVFETYGCIPNLERYLLFYPTYFEKHLQLEQSLFEGDKIDRKIAYFLAFCAAAQKGSVYMMIRYFKRFQAAGGDNDWIKKAKYPAKYKNILTINRLMAKAVWQINEDLLSQIVQNSGHHWGKNQMAVCLEIFAFAQQNSTLALAMGLLSEQSLAQNQFLQVTHVQNEIRKYQEKFMKYSQESQALNSVIPFINSYEEFEKEQNEKKQEKNMKKKEVKKSFQGIKKNEGDDQVFDYMKEIGSQLSKQGLLESINKGLTPLLEPHRHVEKRKEQLYPDIDSSEYNFIFNAYPALNNLTQNIADNLLNLITYSQKMTRDNFGTATMSSTKEFRKAMRYYAQNLCGYRHQEYNFKHVNTFLTIALKFYIRLLTLSPVYINQQVIKEIHHESGKIECFDLGHVAVLIACTKMGLDLTLCMRNMQLLEFN